MKKYRYLTLDKEDAFMLCIPKTCSVIHAVHQINFLLVPR